MKSKGMGLLCGMATLSLTFGTAVAQTPPPAGPGGLLTGPANVSPHWSKYKYPQTVPDGAIYHIIQKGDTLWDLSRKYLNNPLLWPQIWDKNKYVTDAHWIYPGDPLIIPVVAMVAPSAGEAEPPPPPVAAVKTTTTEEVSRPALYAVTEETSLQCASHLATAPEDDSLRVLGSEQGSGKLALSDRDILYLSKGNNAGVKTGDVFLVQHASYTVKHPKTGKKMGTKVETTGWVRVILVQENSATAIVEQACSDLHAGDYLRPFEKVTVPMILRHEPPDRLTPPSGKVDGYVADIDGDADNAAEGTFLTLDLGSENGLAPGSTLVVYRIMYPSVPTSRNVIGEVAVVSIRANSSLAKVLYSNDTIVVGDRIEAR